MRIRRAVADDWPQIEALLTSAALPIEGAPEAFGQMGFVAEAEGRIVGTVALELFDDTALLRSLAVDPAWRGQGLGRRLVDTALAEARDRQVSSVYLLTTTAESFFPRCGFELTPRAEMPASVRQSVEFQSACPSNATAMTIRVGSPETDRSVPPALPTRA